MLACLTLCGSALVGSTAEAGPRVDEYSTGLTKGRDLLELIAGRDGNMWFVGGGCLRTGCSNGGSSAIGRITPGGTITEFRRGFPVDRRNDISNLTWGPDGHLWFLGPHTRSIGRMTVKGRVKIFKAGLPSGFEGTGEILKGPEGLLYVPAVWRHAGRLMHGFVRIGRDSSMTTVATDTTFNVWLTLAGDGNFWNAGNPPRGQSEYFQRTSPDGVVTRFGNGLDDLRYLCGTNPSVASDGRLWCRAITRSDVPLLIRLDPTTGQLQRFATTANTQFVRPEGAWWFAGSPTDAGSDRGRGDPSPAVGSIELRQITATGDITTVASSQLPGKTRQGFTSCLAQDDSLYYVVSVPRSSQRARRLGVSELSLFRLRPGATSSTAVPGLPAFHGSASRATLEGFRDCTPGAGGNLWFLDNGPPKVDVLSHRYRHRIGRITIR